MRYAYVLAALACLGSPPLAAADLSSRGDLGLARLQNPAADWTGLYVAGFGAAQSWYDLHGGPRAIAGGARAGADLQVSDRFVLGAMVDGVLTNARGTGVAPPLAVNSYVYRSLVTADVRIGVPFDDVLLYGVAGWSHAGINASQVAMGTSRDLHFESIGYNVGTGVEYRFTRMLGAFGEYRWNQFGDLHGGRLGEARAGMSLRY